MNFNNCNHQWDFHIDACSSGGPAAGNTMMICEKCKTVITLLEKSALDQTLAQSESLKIQEKNTRISMYANLIAAGTLVIAFLTLLFGERLLQCLS